MAVAQCQRKCHALTDSSPESVIDSTDGNLIIHIQENKCFVMKTYSFWSSEILVTGIPRVSLKRIATVIYSYSEAFFYLLRFVG